MRCVACAALLLATVFAAPLAHADEEVCKVGLGRGWPPATENYGTAVEQMVAGSVRAPLSFTLLPAGTSVERGLALIPGATEAADWTLRYVEADQRVRVWVADHLELRTNQVPDVNEVPMPAPVATRLLTEWMHALAVAAPSGTPAPFSEKDTWVFVAGDLRASGLEPGCKLGEQLRDQIDLLVEATDEGEEKRQKRWRQLGEKLDHMRQTVDGPSAVAGEPDSEPEKRRGWSLFK
ncbi:MAG TPA: hypothetical protein VIT22_03000 [Pseudoxanthomonas sp.]